MTKDLLLNGASPARKIHSGGQGCCSMLRCRIQKILFYCWSDADVRPLCCLFYHKLRSIFAVVVRRGRQTIVPPVVGQTVTSDHCAAHLTSYFICPIIIIPARLNAVRTGAFYFRSSGQTRTSDHCAACWSDVDVRPGPELPVQNVFPFYLSASPLHGAVLLLPC